MKYVISYLSVFVLVIFAAACSDISDEITTPVEVGIHSEGILNSSSNNFHGKLLGENGFKDCQQCHASTLTGGTAGESCVKCHSSIGVHQDGIKSPSSDNFHAKFLKNNGLMMNECSQCHGEEYEGGYSSPTCQNCHKGIAVHKTGIKSPSSENFHGKFIQAHNYDLGECSQCHGDNYAGGLISTSCNICHDQSNGPEACNTCHGDFNNPVKIAPEVGAHYSHLENTVIAAEVSCETCHNVPAAFNSAGHIDSTPGAEVILTGAAGEGSTFNPANMTCNNTYCHGNFEFLKSESNFQFVYTADKMEGNNFNPDWNKLDASQAACGTCHGLPPVGHIPSDLSSCVNCHAGVVDAAGNIIDKTKHINGVKNTFGN